MRKGNKLAQEIEKDLFDNINAAGLDDTVNSKPEIEKDHSSPKVNKKGSTLGFGGAKEPRLMLSKRTKSTFVPLKPMNKLARLKRTVTSMFKKSKIPKYEYKPDKMALRMLILRSTRK